jgi:aromatic ring-opening dioxygenase LigB subunit
MYNCINITQNDKLKLEFSEERYRQSEAKLETSRKHFEKVMKEKNGKIRELEIENEVLKKRHTGMFVSDFIVFRQSSK